MSQPGLRAVLVVRVWGSPGWFTVMSMSIITIMRIMMPNKDFFLPSPIYNSFIGVFLPSLTQFDSSLKEKKKLKYLIVHCISNADLKQEKGLQRGWSPVNVLCSVPPYPGCPGPGEICTKFRWPGKNAGLIESKKCSRSEMKCQQLSIGLTSFLTLLPLS